MIMVLNEDSNKRRKPLFLGSFLACVNSKHPEHTPSIPVVNAVPNGDVNLPDNQPRC